MMKANESEPDCLTLHCPFSEVVHQLTGWEDPLEEAIWGHRLAVDTLKLNMPVELKVEVGDAGNVMVKGSAPTQALETTVMPVFHRVRITMEQVKANP